jgi:hypothetical protein
MPVDPAVPDPERIATQADFGHELKALREGAGMTIRDLAKAAGLPSSTVGDYSSGKHLPTDPGLLERTLRACGETDPERVAAWKAALPVPSARPAAGPTPPTAGCRGSSRSTPAGSSAARTSPNSWCRRRPSRRRCP